MCRSGEYCYSAYLNTQFMLMHLIYHLLSYMCNYCIFNIIRNLRQIIRILKHKEPTVKFTYEMEEKCF